MNQQAAGPKNLNVQGLDMGAVHYSRLGLYFINKSGMLLDPGMTIFRNMFKCLSLI